MRKTITLESGHEVELYWGWLDYKRTLTNVALRYGRITLGGLVLCGNHEYKPPHYTYWYNNKNDEDEAAAYYTTKYPDLAGQDRTILFREGFAREADLGPVIERARELAAAVNQDGKRLFLAIDAVGRIFAYGDSAPDAFEMARCEGWEGWFSPDRADEETLWLVPADRVRVRVAD
jgi:hypothetical protein